MIKTDAYSLLDLRQFSLYSLWLWFCQDVWQYFTPWGYPIEMHGTVWGKSQEISGVKDFETFTYLSLFCYPCGAVVQTGPYVNHRHFKTWWTGLAYLLVLCSQKKTTYLKYLRLWAVLSQTVKCSTLYFHHERKYSFSLNYCGYVRENMLVSGSQMDLQYFL